MARDTDARHNRVPEPPRPHCTSRGGSLPPAKAVANKFIVRPNKRLTEIILARRVQLPGSAGTEALNGRSGGLGALVRHVYVRAVKQHNAWSPGSDVNAWVLSRRLYGPGEAPPSCGMRVWRGPQCCGRRRCARNDSNHRQVGRGKEGAWDAIQEVRGGTSPATNDDMASETSAALLVYRGGKGEHR